MPPRTAPIKQSDRKSILVIPSRVVSRPDELQGGEETEIAAQISVPTEGGWGWFVVFCSFWSIFLMDGVAFTFGSLLGDITKDLKTTESLVVLINSITIAIYFIGGPLASAFINRFGFRACIMCGSVISSFALSCSYFANNYASLCVFYGVFNGFGCCLINMSSALVVGFYFEKLRSVALSIATTGSSTGIMVMFPVNTYLVKLAGWRVTTLLHCSLFGIIYFLGMSFRPLLSLTVMKTTDDPTRTVTYLPNLSTAALKQTTSRLSKTEGLMPTATERLFSAVSNANFPTAAAVLDEGIIAANTQPGPSAAAVSRLTLTAQNPNGAISRRQLKQVQSIISRTSVQDKTKKNVEVTINVQEPKKRSCWARLCHWDDHVPQSRPMYRDDAFYDGRIEKLPAYQKSMLDTAAQGKTGLEYQLAVSRAVTTADLTEKRGVFTTAVRRILATMMDPTLLKKRSFLLLCTCGFLIYLGFLVPYIYIQNRNEKEGIDPWHCTFFVSTIGLANATGRLVLGALACKFDSGKLFTFCIILAGLSTIASNFSFNVYYQYLYCFVFGFSTASLACLRSLVVVNLYSLDKLTNATGIMLMFQGLGSLISTPIASIIKNNFGFDVSFYTAGIFITISGVCLLPVQSMAKKENKGIAPTQAANVPLKRQNVSTKKPEKLGTQRAGNSPHPK
ncbi:hypothetical protein K1T71_006032 [Dendrolimus kikuchii]|uniref:Uncharacterized protein n=1 Tax=Dendrolimus kikuchii TaxID=765133 RepID=A0ACC1D3A8_9NEOP|nr:hypothetical protein K1T71_006032 [Dendrolimus kikuchii]